MLIAALQLLLAAFAAAQYPINGTCPSFDECRDQNVDVLPHEIEGVWFLYASIPFGFEVDFKCTFNNLTWIPGTKDFSIVRTERDVKTNVPRRSIGMLNFTTEGFIHFDYSNCEWQVQ